MAPAELPVLIIDGDRLDDLDDFAREFSALLEDHTWHGNLDAFNDILRGGSTSSRITVQNHGPGGTEPEDNVHLELQ
jgi:hypothetical protein